jgi:hypothetical protein
MRTMEGAMTLIRVLHQVWARRTSSCSEVGGNFFYELNVEILLWGGEEGEC